MGFVVCRNDSEKGSGPPVDGFEGVGIPSAPPYETLEGEQKREKENAWVIHCARDDHRDICIKPP